MATTCDSGTGVCVGGQCGSCTKDAQCQGSAFGAACVSDFRCGCNDAQDCAAAAAGPLCDAYSHQCSCAHDGDCQAGARCDLIVPGLGVCRAACHSDQDCNGSFAQSFNEAGHVRCDVPSGKCVDCVSDTQCANHCAQQTHTCVQCLASSECAQSAGGHVCSDGSCGCATSADCTAPAVCQSYYGSAVGTCKQPCVSAVDCPLGMPVCQPNGACSTCQNDAQCGDGKKCAPNGQCATCTDDASCSGNPGGPWCQYDHSCGCQKKEECAGSPAGPVCLFTKGSASCGCEKAADCAPGKKCVPVPSTPFAVCQ